MKKQIPATVNPELPVVFDDTQERDTIITPKHKVMPEKLSIEDAVSYVLNGLTAGKDVVKVSTVIGEILFYVDTAHIDIFDPVTVVCPEDLNKYECDFQVLIPRRKSFDATEVDVVSAMAKVLFRKFFKIDVQLNVIDAIMMDYIETFGKDHIYRNYTMKQYFVEDFVNVPDKMNSMVDMLIDKWVAGRVWEANKIRSEVDNIIKKDMKIVRKMMFIVNTYDRFYCRLIAYLLYVEQEYCEAHYTTERSCYEKIFEHLIR